MIIEASEDYEQPLGLTWSASGPGCGLLEWTKGKRAVFSSRGAAREAIRRTDNYRLAMARTDLPEARFCKIIMVERVEAWTA